MTELPPQNPREKIVAAAADLLHEGGPAAVTTRGVAQRAGVQAPAIYRLFGDKDGLLDAVAEHVMATFVAGKTAAVQAETMTDSDPLADLAHSWRRQIDFGLANPSVFRLLSDPERALGSPAARAGREVLLARLNRVAMTGRLRVSATHAADLIQAAGVGTIQTLLATPTDQRDPLLPEAMLTAVLTQILTPDAAGAPPTASPTAAVVALRAFVPGLDALTAAEKALLAEWLDRLSAAQ